MYKVSNPKGEIIKFRVDRRQKITVEKYCKQNKITLSKLFRGMIETLKAKI